MQGNTSNIVFLKSTDDAMIETLVKMSGTTHKSYIDQKTVTRDMEKLMLANEGKASYMMQTKEVPVLSYNDFAFIAERNSIVLRAGDAPVWNRNETILPMSWRLFQNTIEVPGKKFTLQTIPTLSSAVDFDLKKNQPDFDELLKTRMEQAVRVEMAESSYKINFEYDDDDIHRLDIDVYAADIMDMVDTQIERDIARASDVNFGDDDEWDESDYQDVSEEAQDYNPGYPDWYKVEENTEVESEVEKYTAAKAEMDAKIYAHGSIAKSDLVSRDGTVAIHRFDQQILDIYMDMRGDIEHDPAIMVAPDGSVCSADGAQIFICKKDSASVANEVDALYSAAGEEQSRVFAEDIPNLEDADPETGESIERFASYEVTDEFYFFLASLPDWKSFAHGCFENLMYEKLVEGSRLSLEE